MSNEELTEGLSPGEEPPTEEHSFDALAKGLANRSISRRAALKLLSGTALGLLVLPSLPSTASAAGKLQATGKTSLGTFEGVEYVQHEGLFVGKTSTGKYRVPYWISAPANPRRANSSAVLVEPPHFVVGTGLRDDSLGRPFLFGQGFLHAAVGYSTFGSRILDPEAPGVFIEGGVELSPEEQGFRTDDEIVVDFARALRTDPVARALMGPAVRRRYLAGFSDSSYTVKRIVASGLAQDVFDLAVPITTDNANDPQTAIAEGKYSGKVITVDSEFEWFYGRALEDRGETPDHYRFFIVPGTPHISDPLCPTPAPASFANHTTPASWQPALRAHFLQGHAWVTQGEAPPTSTRLATADGDAQIARDSNGNALLVEITGASAPRLPYVELGEARFVASAGNVGIARLLGTYEPKPPPTYQDLGFSSLDEYLAEFQAALDAQVQAGYMLKEDADVLLKRAGLSDPATFTRNYFERYEEFRSGEYCPPQ